MEGPGKEIITMTADVLYPYGWPLGCLFKITIVLTGWRIGQFFIAIMKCIQLTFVGAGISR